MHLVNRSHYISYGVWEHMLVLVDVIMTNNGLTWMNMRHYTVMINILYTGSHWMDNWPHFSNPSLVVLYILCTGV